MVTGPCSATQDPAVPSRPRTKYGRMILGVAVGYAKKRIGRDGKPRYTACYLDLRGRLRSAGTFDTEKKANEAWQGAEVKQREGRLADPKRGKQKFERYVKQEWLPNHVMELSTRERCEKDIDKHLMPWFGAMKMNEIFPSDVREWITHLQNRTPKLKPKTIRNLVSILSSIFTTALDEVTFIHPCKGVKTPTVPKKTRKIINAKQFDIIYEKLPDADAQLLVETDVETGLRWGEIAELRVCDLDRDTRIVTVSRSVIQVSRKNSPDGSRFVVKDYPKDGEYRRFKISAQLNTKLGHHIETLTLAPDDLIFAIRELPQKKPELTVLPDPAELGLTEPNHKGRQYQHGTPSGYNAGRCRCRHCKAAIAAYRAKRRAAGKDESRQPRMLNTDGHIPADWFRTHIWLPALQAAELGVHVRFQDLRHAHASWLLAGGADLQVVKERLGHGSITTTEKYLHTLDDADETALDALANIRGRSTA